MPTLNNVVRLLVLLCLVALFASPLIAVISELDIDLNWDKESWPLEEWSNLNDWIIPAVGFAFGFILLGSLLAAKKVDVGKTLIWVGILTLVSTVVIPWLGEDNISESGKLVGCSIYGGQTVSCQELGARRLGFETTSKTPTKPEGSPDKLVIPGCLATAEDDAGWSDTVTHTNKGWSVKTDWTSGILKQRYRNSLDGEWEYSDTGDETALQMGYCTTFPPMANKTMPLEWRRKR